MHSLHEGQGLLASESLPYLSLPGFPVELRNTKTLMDLWITVSVRYGSSVTAAGPQGITPLPYYPRSTAAAVRGTSSFSLIPAGCLTNKTSVRAAAGKIPCASRHAASAAGYFTALLRIIYDYRPCRNPFFKLFLVLLQQGTAQTNFMPSPCLIQERYRKCPAPPVR